jgi:ABC-type branched-subunit amino acid transport system permease subunit
MFAPFLFPGRARQEVAARICVFIVLVASYDLLIGYTGIVSFAHTMFFGLGAYGTAIALRTMGPGWEAILIGGGAACCRPRAGGADRHAVAQGERRSSSPWSRWRPPRS